MRNTKKAKRVITLAQLKKIGLHQENKFRPHLFWVEGIDQEVRIDPDATFAAIYVAIYTAGYNTGREHGRTEKIHEIKNVLNILI